MKTKTLILLCLLLGMTLIQLSAQTKSIVSYDTYNRPPDEAFWIPVVCDGEYIDWLWATDYTIKNLVHFKDGNDEWFHSRWTEIKLTSESTGEVFTPHGGEKGDTDRSSGNYVIETKVNLKGSMGSQYVLHYSLTFGTWEFEVNTSNCH
jgi:hypothetical protein